MGLLRNGPMPNWHPADGEIREVCQQAAKLCTEKGTDLAKLAIQFSVQHENIPTTLVSTASPENMRRNIKWTEEPIDQQLLLEVLKILEPIHNRTWTSGTLEWSNGDKI